MAAEGKRVGIEAKPKILLCLSGSVATIKVPELAVMLAEFAEVKILTTKASRHFLERSVTYNPEAHSAFTALDPSIPVLGDADEWEAWNAVGDPVLHIELRNWADMVLIAPLSANTMAKIASGICDNFVTCVARAWDFKNKKPFVIAPAMNTCMWDHPLTSRHIAFMEELGIVVIPPATKVLACGDRGIGALATVETICEAVRKSLGVTQA